MSFIREAINAEPDEWQVRELAALAVNDKISIRACHGPGKSTFDAWAILWFIVTHYPCKIPCTAPTGHQLKDILWSELSIWHKRMIPSLRDKYAIKSSDQDMRFYLISNPEEAFAVARTGRKENPEAIQGFHSPNLMFILDEASGIDEIVFEVASGALSTEGAKVLMTANPTRTSGYFYDSHHSMRHRWHTAHISHEDSPRVTQQYAEDMADKYGIDSNVYKVRVLGEFPSTDDDSIISLEDMSSAIDRDIVQDTSTEIVWGLDVARFGMDRTALAKRQGHRLLEPIQSWHGKDTMEVAGMIALEYESTHYKPISINVDVIGIGAGVVDRLKELGLPVRGINVAEVPAINNGRFQRLRDELWFAVRDWFSEKQCRIPKDDDLIGELSAVKYQILSSGKIKVEGKDEMKKRGVRSPDLADSLCLTFARGVSKGRKAPIKYPDLGIV